MRTTAMLPLRGLQTLPPVGLERGDAARTGSGMAQAGEASFDRALQDSRDAGVVVGISPAAASLLEGSGALAPADIQPSGSSTEEPFEPEIFGDDADEQVEDASRIGMNATADDLGGSDIERFGAAEDFGKDGVFQIYGAQPDDVGADRPDPAEEARQARIDEATPGGELTPDEQEVVNELRTRDAEVRSHEAAHMAAGGGLTGGMSLSYQVGPDGKRYAIGGEVSIDASPGSTPEETVLKAQKIRAAALAPAEPSAQDRAVAARAGQMESDARSQLRVQQANELRQSLQGLQPGEEADGFPPETVTLGEVKGLEPEAPALDLPPVAEAESTAVEADPAVEAAIAERGEAIDLMAIFEKITGSGESDASDTQDEAEVRLGGRLSGFGSGTAADAQLMGSGSSLEAAVRAVTAPQSQAYALVA